MEAALPEESFRRLPLPLEAAFLAVISIVIGVVLGISLAGPLGDRYGMRTFLAIGTGLEIAGLALTSVASSYPLLLMACAIGGMGAGTRDALLSPLICTVCPERRVSGTGIIRQNLGRRP